MTMKYRFIDNITSDVLFEAYGGDLKAVFENAAEAMFSVICKMDKINALEERTIEAEADDIEDLMINWLQALIAEVDIENMFFKEFLILEIDDKHLKAVIKGEDISPEKGETVVKAVTYHQYKFEKTPEGYKVRVSLDI